MCEQGSSHRNLPAETVGANRSVYGGQPSYLCCEKPEIDAKARITWYFSVPPKEHRKKVKRSVLTVPSTCHMPHFVHQYRPRTNEMTRQSTAVSVSTNIGYRRNLRIRRALLRQDTVRTQNSKVKPRKCTDHGVLES